jgi:hypothetical protein
LKQKFPNLSEAQITEGIFVCPQIRGFMRESTVDGNLSENIRENWRALKALNTNSFRIFQGKYYELIFQKLHHLGFISDGHRERLHYPRWLDDTKEIVATEIWLTIAGDW